VRRFLSNYFDLLFYFILCVHTTASRRAKISLLQHLFYFILFYLFYLILFLLYFILFYRTFSGRTLLYKLKQAAVVLAWMSAPWMTPIQSGQTSVDARNDRK